MEPTGLKPCPCRLCGMEPAESISHPGHVPHQPHIDCPLACRKFKADKWQALMNPPELASLRKEVEELRRDKELLDGIQQIMLKGDYVGNELVFHTDYEDGFWLARADRTWPHTLPLESESNHKDLRSALAAAIQKDQV